MSVTTKTSFDSELFKRSYEGWDIEALLSLYDADVEIIQIGPDNPPSSPSIRRGSEVLRGMFEHCAAAGVEASVTNAVLEGDRFAATVTCVFPGGRTVTANSICELRSGVIVREHDVVVGDRS